jgi:hypothetical protein
MNEFQEGVVDTLERTRGEKAHRRRPPAGRLLRRGGAGHPHAHDGHRRAAAGNPILFANKAFVELSGYAWTSSPARTRTS